MIFLRMSAATAALLKRTSEDTILKKNIWSLTSAKWLTRIPLKRTLFQCRCLIRKLKSRRLNKKKFTANLRNNKSPFSKPHGLVNKVKEDPSGLEKSKIEVLPTPKELLANLYQDLNQLKPMVHQGQEGNNCSATKDVISSPWSLIQPVEESEDEKEISDQY